MEKRYRKPPIVFKTDIDWPYFNRLRALFRDSDEKEMIYMYFDTSILKAEAKLFSLDIRLRARLKDGKYSLEIKSKRDGLHFNYFQPISVRGFHGVFWGEIPDGKIKQILDELNLNCGIRFVAATYTVRAKKNFEGGVLILDKTANGSAYSYQLEFRSTQQISAEKLVDVKKKLGLVGDLAHRSKIRLIWT